MAGSISVRLYGPLGTGSTVSPSVIAGAITVLSPSVAGSLAVGRPVVAGTGSVYSVNISTGGSSGFPDATSTGPRFSSLHSIEGGLAARTTSALPAWTTGTGTISDPFIISRTTFNGLSWAGGYTSDPSDWAGKYIEYHDCEVFGEPGNPTPSNSLAAGTRTDIDVIPAYITYKYCRIGPNAVPVANGGPPTSIGGFNAAFWSRAPFKLDHCDLWGAAVTVQFVSPAGTSAPRSYIQDCWIHDQWLSPGDHTDAINGADPTNASNVSVLRNTIDGKCAERGAPFRTVYGTAIYNTNAITGWIIDGNLFKNFDDAVFWAGVGQGSTITDMTVTNNTFDLSNLGDYFQGRTSILTWSGNVDLEGNPLSP